jgi:hypothetical protein
VALVASSKALVVAEFVGDEGKESDTLTVLVKFHETRTIRISRLVALEARPSVGDTISATSNAACVEIVTVVVVVVVVDVDDSGALVTTADVVVRHSCCATTTLIAETSSSKFKNDDVSVSRMM